MTDPVQIRRGCTHTEVDIDAILADDRLAAALAAPVIPGTDKQDLQLWLIRLYRRIYKGNATVEGACALLHQHPPTVSNSLCLIVPVIWTRSADLEDLTDTGNARRLATLSGTEITHDPATGWRIWADSAWRGDPDGTVVQRWAKRVAPLLDREADQIYAQARAVRAHGGEDAAQEVAKLEHQAGLTKTHGQASQSAKLIGAMTKLVRDEPGVLTRADQWDANPRLLACPGSTVELTPDGHTIRGPRRADRLTKLTKARPGTSTPAPLWEKFLARSLPDPEVRTYVQKLLGYGLLAGNPRRLLPIFIGPTSAGKTTCAEIIRHVLGDHAGPFSLALFRGKMDEGPRQDLVKALGRRIIIASEASARWQLHADEIKRLVGNDSVQARDAYAKESAMVERQPAFMPILCCNHVPHIVDADPATWRRLIAVPWNVTISQADEDEHLGEKIRTQEADGVLDWLLHGYDLCCAFGLESPHAVVQATMQLRDSLTIRDHWLVSETEQDEDYSETADTLWSAYKKWCESGGIPADQMGTHIAFGRWLADRPGLARTKVREGKTSVRGWKGLRLRQTEFAEHESG